LLFSTNLLGEINLSLAFSAFFCFKSKAKLKRLARLEVLEILLYKIIASLKFKIYCFASVTNSSNVAKKRYVLDTGVEFGELSQY
jgi:hypothetical protein